MQRKKGDNLNIDKSRDKARDKEGEVLDEAGRVRVAKIDIWMAKMVRGGNLGDQLTITGDDYDGRLVLRSPRHP